MKIIISILIVGIFSYIGHQLGDFHRKRFLFISGLINYLNYLNINVMSNKEPLLKVSSKYLTTEKNSEIKLCISEYLKCIGDNKDYIFSNKLFNENENNMINSFFNQIGKNESKSEIKNLEEFSKYFEEFRNDLKQKTIKFSSVYTKLGFLFGCLIVLIII